MTCTVEVSDLRGQTVRSIPAYSIAAAVLYLDTVNGVKNALHTVKIDTIAIARSAKHLLLFTPRGIRMFI